MTSLAVVAHRHKQLGGGLAELRELLRGAGHEPDLWYEIDKSRKAPRRVAEALAGGADRILAWGGDSTVQRCIDALAGTDVPLAILPAGTANLLATNLGIPAELESAVAVALHGVARRLDVGTVNGEHFAVMAGTGFDAAMIAAADRGLKDRFGQAAYVWTGARAAGATNRAMRVRVDGHRWFDGDASCVLVANVGRIAAGVEAFEHARPDDGRLDVGVITATTRWQWARLAAALLAGRQSRSKYVELTTARKVDVRLDRKARYELDGGDRPATKRLRVRVRPRAITICMPA
ncbi:MAG: diacylglycerol/lipid kinase family protein [Acidimicrobiia bacterium]